MSTSLDATSPRLTSGTPLSCDWRGGGNGGFSFWLGSERFWTVRLGMDEVLENGRVVLPLGRSRR
jgi:hypothetical protein